MKHKIVNNEQFELLNEDIRKKCLEEGNSMNER